MAEDVPLPLLPGFVVLHRLGRGGMGEVLEAERVGPGGFRKRVALKQLALDLSIDKGAVQRFLLEARICARLEHDNIVRVHDLSMEADRPTLVMELLRGVTLWDLARHLRAVGPVPWWIPFAVADQALSGLAYAHALRSDEGNPLGLVHRDLTPRNLMVTESGVVKVLDFGIAKLTASLTSPPLTAHGTLQGTLEFFSPEQAKGIEVDARSDLFQIAGAIYWALANRTPHGAGTAAEVVVRAINLSPPSLKTLVHGIPEAVSDTLEQMMALDPSRRFADATAMQQEVRKLLATVGSPGPQQLAALVGNLDLPPARPSAPAPSPEPRSSELEPTRASVRPPELSAQRDPEPRPESPDRGLGPTRGSARTLGDRPAARSAGLLSRRTAALALAGAALSTAAYYGGRRSVSWTPRPPRKPPEYARLTFGRGTVYSARFAGDDSFVYSASFGDSAIHTWLGVHGNPEGRSLDLGATEVAAISRQQELALLTDIEQRYGFVRRGTLALAQLSGGAPRSILEGVQWADYHPETGALAVVRWKDEQAVLEFPRETVRHHAQAGWIGGMRFSPRGRHLAFVVHPARYDDSGTVFVLDTTDSAPARAVTGEYSAIKGLAWADADTLWFTASKEGLTKHLYSVDLAGRPQLLERAPVSLRLLDVGRAKRALLVRESVSIESAGRFAGDSTDRDLSIFDATFAVHVSPDGAQVLVGEGAGDAVGPEGAVLLQPRKGHAVRLGTGVARDLSPDGRWALSSPVDRKSAQLLPTGAGMPKNFPLEALLEGAAFFPDGEHLILSTADGETQNRFFRVEIASGVITELPIKGFLAPLLLPVTPDGKQLAVTHTARRVAELVTLETGSSEPIKGALAGETVLRVSADGKSVYLAQLETHPLEVFKIELHSGRRERVLTLGPADASGVDNVLLAVLAPDGKSWAFTYHRVLSTLFLATGID